MGFNKDQDAKLRVSFFSYLTARYAASSVMDPHQSKVAPLHESLAKS